MLEFQIINETARVFIADLDRLLCKLPTDALITILSGDFNVNVKKRDKQSDSLLKLDSNTLYASPPC
jgi:lipid A disaccharide synthetase